MKNEERNTLKKLEILSKKADFKNIILFGKKIENEFIRLYFLRNNLQINRIAIVVSRKTGGGAVKRNKIKRRIREIYRKNKQVFGEFYDIIFMPKGNLLKLTYSDTEKIIFKLVEHLKFSGE
ncbi:MAG: ribonuclease P protein component [bacterium]